MKAKIFSAYHLQALKPKSSNIVPSQVGGLEFDLNMPHSDAVGHNISHKNNLYSELTLQYQVWQNELSKLDYVGICHYRRLFNPHGPSIVTGGKYEQFEYGKRSRPQVAFNQDTWDAVTSDKTVAAMVALLSPGHKMVTLQPFQKTNQWSLWTLAGLNWVPVRTVIEFFEYCQKTMTYDEFTVFNKEINQSHDHFCNNMIFCDTDTFAKYSSWLFDLLFGFEQHLLEVEKSTGLTLIVPRMFGYFSEYMLRPWTVLHGIRPKFVDSICFTDLKLDTRI